MDFLLTLIEIPIIGPIAGMIVGLLGGMLFSFGLTAGFFGMLWDLISGFF